MTVTLRKIADRLELSHSTVSRVLSNPTNPLYSEETRERVLTTAHEMGYTPNLAARSLRNARTNMVGIFGSPSGLWASLGPDIARGISAVLHPRRLDLFFAFSAQEPEMPHELPAWRFDGAIVVQNPAKHIVQGLRDSKQPFVSINEKVEGAPAVLCDEEPAIGEALAHLWSLGHRRIAYFNASRGHHVEHYSVLERHRAYLSFLQEHGCPPMPGHDKNPAGQDLTEAVRLAVQDGKATAAVAYDHVIAVDVLSAAQRLGLRVPHDFSLICVNDEFLIRRLAPPLTVIAPPGEELGRLGAEMLLQMMDAPEADFPAVIRVPARLLVRESTAPPGLLRTTAEQ